MKIVEETETRLVIRDRPVARAAFFGAVFLFIVGAALLSCHRGDWNGVVAFTLIGVPLLGYVLHVQSRATTLVLDRGDKTITLSHRGLLANDRQALSFDALQHVLVEKTVFQTNQGQRTGYRPILVLRDEEAEWEVPVLKSHDQHAPVRPITKRVNKWLGVKDVSLRTNTRKRKITAKRKKR